MEKLNDFLDSNYRLIILLLLGFILIGIGAFVYKNGGLAQSNTVEVLNSSTDSQNDTSDIVAEITGAVEKPGVYKFKSGARIEDLIISAGGISESADRDWVEKFVNKAAKITDGQKVYIYHSYESTANKNDSIKVGQEVLGVSEEGQVNINTASLTELDKLPGIGPVYGQKIIDGRIYSDVSELLSKGVLTNSVYEKIKDKITVY